ncbi:outer membrane transport energization protein TonB [Crinalium epipsammum PCC 9333]|uniref:Outer membrane transport energization protein TonB n=1 Tax=Crinalium epipsammum PCC 9333 TaxID=1173022 RepID=K9VUN5_9CYAN|nr:energy transducer TonB [Crinalium epipsammum]AFZ11274.1 outer membrane transport energization protein TonB [Crinalium epipsammum PCC 9333]
MGVSTIAVEQREKEEQQLRSFLTYSLIGSVVTHISLLILSTLWVKPAEVAAEEPIEIEIVDAPSIEETKPPENTELPAEATAGGGSGGSGGGFAGGSGGGAGASEIETSSASAQVAPKSVSADPRLSSITSAPLPSIAPQPEVPQFKIPDVPPPLSTRQIVSSLLPAPPVVPQLDPIPTPVASVPQEPVKPIPEETPAPDPTPLASLPSDAIAEPVKPTPTPSPSPTPTPTPSPVVNASPPVQPSQPATPRFPNFGSLAQKVTNFINPKNNTPTLPPLAANSLVPSNNTGGANNSSKVAVGTSNAFGANRGTGSGTGSGTGTGNGNGSGFGSGSGTGSGFGTGSGTGTGDGSGTGTKVATGSRNINRTPPAPRSGNTRPNCNPCTKPRHPSGAEELEGTVVVKMDVDKDGNVSNINLASGSGHNILDQTALETVRNEWKFTKSDNGEAGIKKKITFTLEGSNYNRTALERQRLADKKQKERQQQQERQRQALESQEKLDLERQQREANQLMQPVPAGIPDNRLPLPSVPSTPAAPPPTPAAPLPTPAPVPSISVPPVPEPNEMEQAPPPDPSASP